ncbi:MAG: LytTR family DNA-binding domain-containing protein [Bacteroidales bacterium]|jgi:DNA-binding LytR/AlgR family response regulator|nr:LytTR family DNA-binding domain-containing protein [Bacteroidales bacterium]
MALNTINCIAIDNDPAALRVIREYCSKIQFLNLTGVFSNPFEAVHDINNNQPDLIFIDVVMPQITGPEFIKTLYNPPFVIFTSFSGEYAIEGFECDAVDYLLKPVSFERFSKAVNKAFMLMKMKNPAEPAQGSSAAAPGGFLLVKVEYTTIRVGLNEILFIEGLKDYVKIHAEGRLVLTKTTMKNIMDRLPSESFFRVHKSYIISLDKIDMIENSRIVIGNQRIPIGESYRPGFFELLNRNMI